MEGRRERFLRCRVVQLSNVGRPSVRFPSLGGSQLHRKNMHLRKQELLVAMFSLYVRTQQVWVLRSLLPTSLFEHMSMGHAFPPTDTRDRNNAKSVLSRPLWPFHHCMCVIARRLGSHTQQDMDIFQSASTSRRSISFV